MSDVPLEPRPTPQSWAAAGAGDAAWLIAALPAYRSQDEAAVQGLATHRTARIATTDIRPSPLHEDPRSSNPTNFVRRAGPAAVAASELTG